MEPDAMILVSECWDLSQLFHSPLSFSSRAFLFPLHTSHWRNANQSHNEIPFQTHENDDYFFKKRKHMLVRMWTNRNPCRFLVGMQNGEFSVENNLVAVSLKVKYRITIRSSNSMPRCIPKGIENRGSNRYLLINIQSKQFCNNKKVEPTQTSINV